ncbi:hypothetical protein SLH46_11635 [Draconibacterium sp. IB214405]|uniref:hypothetical protein n=1 Tax=Draconibacterium sp. IB214405 TaxID=3097352 RepID=UPI002A0ECA48|nr:hypothetical protein [Draconibacterium sp. IB214405]MDX8339839.1 hypothetical protein [Draconibacterium sp. IB214405]
MKQLLIILFIFCCIGLQAQQNTIPDVSWGNTHYYNLDIGDTVWFNDRAVVLLDIENQYNTISLGNDTVKVKVGTRSLPYAIYGIRMFVADNKNLKKLTADKDVHGLLTKDALICLSDSKNLLLSPESFIFPVSYNDGFNWNINEDNYMFSYMQQNCENKREMPHSNEGIGIALSDARGIQKHWLLAMESSTVMWVEKKTDVRKNKEACILLQSDSNPSVFYVYDHLYVNNIEVKEGQKVRQGELLGTIWGDENWGYLQLAVVHSDSVPTFENRFANCINFFPQLYELYFKNTFNFSKTFTRGKIEFGRKPVLNGNQKNILSFEEFTGMGWNLGAWNTTEKVMHCTKGELGNARLKKILFANTAAECRNPNNFYEYEINVRNGVYRVRAQVGDVKQASWQKIEFEGIEAATYALEPGEMKWTSEKVIKVNDRRMTVRIYVDPKNQKVAGISEIVFQQAY